ncbi:MAG: transglycosylase domain-containing protein [Candidatus Flexifilum sp.]
MADRPIQTENPSSRQADWHAPQPQTERPLAPESEPVSTEAAVWKAVQRRATSDALTDQPQQQGGWHRPPRQGGAAQAFRRLTEEEAPEAPAEPAPEAVLPIEDAPAPAQPASAGEVQLDSVIPYDEVIPASAEAAEAQVIPFDSGDGLTALAGLAAAADTDEDEEEHTFSMSELIALASLAEREAASEMAAAQPVVAEPAVEAPTTPGELSPAEYARQQLAALEGGQPVVAEPAVEAAPAEPAVVLTPAEEALLGKFRAAEVEVKALRERFRAGLLTREQFQAEARQKMVLDDANTYWMLGVESDNWYHYVNGQWVMETPPVLAKAASAGVQAAPRPTVSAPPTGVEGEMPLPRPVPVRDPDLTQAGTGIFYSQPPAVPTPGAPTGDVLLTGAVPPGETTDIDATLPVRTLEPDVGVDPNLTMPSPGISGQETIPVVTVPNAPVGELTVPSPVAPDVVKPPDYNINIPSTVFEEAQRKQRDRTLRNVLIAAAVVIGACALVGAIGLFGAIAWYNSILEPWRDEIAALASYQPQFQTARVYAADGSLIAELVSENAGARTVVSLEDVSPYLVHAIISVENPTFYDDVGFDPVAIAGAMVQNLTGGTLAPNQNTITQQVVRNLVLQDTSGSPARRLEELVIASAIAQQYDKNFILQLYLNESFFGNQSYGAEAAAEFYFDARATDLDIAQAALLAGLIDAPAAYDPVVNREAAFARMNAVLDRMAAVGCLQFQHAPYINTPFCVTQRDLTSGTTVLAKARVEARNYEPRTDNLQYPHFVNYIQAQIEQSFGSSEMFRRGFNIYTTLDPRVQNAAQTALRQQVTASATLGVNTGAVLVTNPASGAILAMVGSPDVNDASIDGSVNNVFTWQQPGSAIRPVQITAALEGVTIGGFIQYMTPATIVWDVPTSWNAVPPYTPPPNPNGRFSGNVSVRTVLGSGLPTAAVKIYEFVGPDRFRETATRLGLRFLDNAQFSIATGAGATEVRLYDLLQAFATIANNGVRTQTYAITRITDAEGAEIALPERLQPAQTIQPQIAYLMQQMLTDNDARVLGYGPNNGLSLPEYPGLVGALGGVSADNRDLWTLGFTRTAAVGVWMGRHDNAPTRADFQNTALPIWSAVLRAAVSGTNPNPYQPPQGIAQAQICADTGTLFDPAVAPCAQVRTELFIQSQPPPPASAGFVNRNVPVDSWLGLRANTYCPDNVVPGTIVNITDPAAIAWLDSAAGAATAQRLGIPVPVPANVGECQPGQQLPVAQISSPIAGQTVQGTIAITGTITALDFNRYQIELAPANTQNWVLVAGPFGNQVTNSQLASFDTTRVPNGEYQLRLTAFSNAGGYLYRTVNILISNVLPTATPTLLPTAPPAILPTFGPVIPTFPPVFETPLPFPTLGPTPTLDFGP